MQRLVLSILESRERFILAILMVAVSGLLLALHVDLSEDNGWYLYLAARVLDGVPLYDRLLEVNPPLPVWIAVPPALLIEETGISHTLAFTGWVFCLVVGAVVLFSRVVRSGRSLSPLHQRALVMSAAVLLFVAFGGDFGQREHIAVALVLPYLASGAAAARNDKLSVGLAILAGTCAGVGIAFKPHFLPIALCVEGYVVYRARDVRSAFRADSLSLAGVLVLYAILVVWLAPGFWQVALRWGEHYLRFANVPVWSLLLEPATGVTVYAGVLLFLWRNEGDSRQLQVLLFVAACAFLVAALVQHKGWAHHLYPAEVCAALSLILALGTPVREVGTARMLGATAKGLAVCLLCIIGIQRLGHSRAVVLERGVWREPFVEAVRREAADGTVAFLSPDMLPAFPVVNWTGTTWALRVPSLWMLQGSYEERCVLRGQRGRARRSEGSGGTAEREAREMVAEDLRMNRPSLIVMDPRPFESSDGCPSFEAFLREYPRLNHILDEYELRGSVVGYRLYIRRQLSSERGEG